MTDYPESNRDQTSVADLNPEEQVVVALPFNDCTPDMVKDKPTQVWQAPMVS